MNQEKIQINVEKKVRQTSPDGSTPFTTTDSSYLRQHLSDLDLSILKRQQADGIDLSYLTESQVVDLFL